MKRYENDCTCGGWKFGKAKLIKIRWIGFSWENKIRKKGERFLSMFHYIRMSNASELWILGFAITWRRSYLKHVLKSIEWDEKWRREHGLCEGKP